MSSLTSGSFLAPLRRHSLAHILAAVAVLAALLAAPGFAPAADAQANFAPSVPANVRVTWTSNSAVGLSWTPSADDKGVIGYKVFRNGVEIGRNPTNNTARFIATGDMVHCGAQYQAGLRRVRDLMIQNPGRILIPGDSVQFAGAANEFTCFNNIFSAQKSRMLAVPGNHEYNTANATPFFNYFAGQTGAPGKGWFGANWGSWKIIGLNTSCWEPGVGGCHVGSTQYNWLKAELEASTAACTVVIGHHPRWSTRNQGNAVYLAPMWDLLYEHGVELWIAGDDHFYERYPSLGTTGEPNAKGIAQFIVGTGGFETRGYGPYINEGPNATVRHNESFGIAAFDAHARSYTMNFRAEAGSEFNDRTSEPCHGPNSSVIKFRDRGLNNGSTHTYRVAAYDAAGKTSALSAPVTATVGSNQSNPLSPALNSEAPIGEFQLADMRNNEVIVAGWALDPDTNAPINVHIRIDGVLKKVGPALTNRPDIGAAYGQGNNHGFYFRVPTTNKVQQICAWAINNAGTPHKRLGCKLTSAQPEGRVNAAFNNNGSIAVGGWAIDPDTRSNIKIHLFVDGVRRRVFSTGTASPYARISYPGYSNNHGYFQQYFAGPGTHNVCVWAINNTTTGGGHRRLGCQNVTT